MVKYKKFHTTVEIDKYEEGLEDYFKYHIPMFGLFTKKECLQSGFTPDFDKDKIPCIVNQNGEELYIAENDYIVTEEYGDRSICKPEKIGFYYFKTQ